MHCFFSVGFFGLVPEELSYAVFACDWLVFCFLMTFINFKFATLERGTKISETLFMFLFDENKWLT